MNFEVIVTCAVTGAGDTVHKSPHVPVTPKEVADAAIEAAKAGASAAHIHVRDPETGKGSRDVKLFKEAVDRIRDDKTDVVLNLTAGMGGDWVPDENDFSMPGAGTDMIGPDERLAHVEICKPEICSLDCGTLNFGVNDHSIYISTLPILRRMAELTKSWGVKPELEVFDLGHIRLAKQLIEEGLINEPPMFQICLGIPWGADQSVDTMKVMKDHLPSNATWSGFGISRMQVPMATAAVAMGGNVRVGLEDNLYLSKGVLATNGQLVEKIIKIINLMGGRVLTPDETRKKLRIEGIKTSFGRVPKKWFVKGEKDKNYHLCQKAVKDVTLDTADNALVAMKDWSGIDNLRNINNETLIVWGNKDTSYNFDQVDTLNKNIKNSKLEIFRDCAHNVHLEKTDEFNNLVKKFIFQ